jgi:hypothetical protein
MDMRMTIYLAWAVRTALLLLYIPVQILSSTVQAANRLDSWSSAVVVQSATQFEERQLSTHLGGLADRYTYDH